MTTENNLFPPLADTTHSFDFTLPMAVPLFTAHRSLNFHQQVLAALQDAMPLPQQRTNDDTERGQIMYAYLYLRFAHDAMQTAIRHLEALDTQLRQWGTTLPELTEVAQRRANEEGGAK